MICCWNSVDSWKGGNDWSLFPALNNPRRPSGTLSPIDFLEFVTKVFVDLKPLLQVSFVFPWSTSTPQPGYPDLPGIPPIPSLKAFDAPFLPCPFAGGFGPFSQHLDVPPELMGFGWLQNWGTFMSGAFWKETSLRWLKRLDFHSWDSQLQQFDELEPWGPGMKK